MRPYGRGILPQSHIFLYENSEFAQRALFYALCVGHYECGPNYVVQRANFDSFLLPHIVHGRGVGRGFLRADRLLSAPRVRGDRFL